MNTPDREPVALGYADGCLVICNPDTDRDVELLPAGRAYDTELIGVLRGEIDRVDPAPRDVVAAAMQAGELITGPTRSGKTSAARLRQAASFQTPRPQNPAAGEETTP